MTKEPKLVRLYKYWHYQRIKIERQLEAVGDRIEYSNETRKKATTLNQPFKP